MKIYLKKNILLVAIIASSFSVFSQTNVAGAYFTNTNWSISGSPYNLIGDVQIPNGITLTIDPGVHINYSGNYELLVKGTIIANGTNLLPIVFSGSSAGKAMIMFKSTNLSNSHLSDINFNGPKNALQLADESEFTQDPIKNSGILTASYINFTNTAIQTKGYETSASLILDNATIISSLIKGVYPRSEPIEISNSDLASCVVNSDSYNLGIKINNSIINQTNLTIGCCGGNIEIYLSQLTNSSIGEGDGNPKVGPVKLFNSTLNNTPINLPSANFQVSSSTFNYNNSTCLLFGNGIIDCSQIIGSNNGTAIEITGYSGYNIGGSVSLNNTTLKNNLKGIKITNANVVNIDSCNIYNNSTYNIENLSTKTITANRNWWGTTDPAVITNQIYDYYDNINFGMVNYSNYLTVLNTKTPCTILTGIYSNNNEMSDVLNFDIYPNPSHNLLNVDLITINKVNKYSLEIVNPVGQILYSKQLEFFNNTSEIIDVSDFSKGIFIVKLQNGNEYYFKKLLID